MGFVVVPALIPDIQKVYDVYFASFAADPMGAIMLDILFPGGTNTEEFRKAHTAGTLSYWHTSNSQYTFKVVDTDSNEIVGMMICDVFFSDRTEEERKNPGISWLEGEAKVRAETVINPLCEIREQIWGAQRHIYAHVIAVDPKHQRRGAAAALIQWAKHFVDQMGLPVYFEASPTSYKLYEKMGCETLKEKIVHKGSLFGQEEDIEVPLMVLMPKSAGQSFAEWRDKGYPARETQVPNGMSK